MFENMQQFHFTANNIPGRGFSEVAFKAKLAWPANSCEQPFITHLKHLLRHQSTCMHMDISPSLHNFVCTNTIKVETDFIGTL
jgi:hypothetical protein